MPWQGHKEGSPLLAWAGPEGTRRLPGRSGIRTRLCVLGPWYPISCLLHWPKSPIGTLAAFFSLGAWCPALTLFLPRPPLQGLLTVGPQPSVAEREPPPFPTAPLLLVSGLSISPPAFPASKHFLTPYLPRVNPVWFHSPQCG